MEENPMIFKENRASVLFFIHITSDLILNDESVKDAVINAIKSRVQEFFSAKYQLFFACDSECAQDCGVAFSHQNSECKYIVSLDSCNPLFDEKFVDYHLILLDSALHDEQSQAYFDGNSDQMLPGTAVEYIARLPIQIAGNACHNKSDYIQPPYHREYVTSLSIKRKKSLKVFIGLLDNTMFCHLSLDNILHYFSTPAGVQDVIRYGSSSRLIDQIHCPVCNSLDSSFVHTSVGYPRVGFLHNLSDYYKRCHNCGHVFLFYYPENSSDCENFYDLADSELSFEPGNVDSFKSESQLKSSSYYENFLFARNYLIDSILPEISNADICLLDVGAGQGDFLLMLKNSKECSRLSLSGIDYKINPKVASDFSAININLFPGDLESYLTAASSSNVRYDIVTFFEVIEHIHPDLLTKMPALLAGILNPGGKIILSTPDFESIGARLTDFWAAYVPQHYSVFSYASLIKLFSTYFAPNSCVYRSYPFGDLRTELGYYGEYYSSRSKPALDSLFAFLFEEASAMPKADRWSKLPCEMIVVLNRIA
jgi:2-polyprenyl-3-methyl-5-hydroxy-6-metoxy-1,4-benzoquinol methylase